MCSPGTLRPTRLRCSSKNASAQVKAWALCVGWRSCYQSPMTKPSIARLHEVFICDIERGLLWWRVQRGRQKAGDPAGTPKGDGYTMVRLDRCALLRHHVVWAMATGAWPEPELDHEHGLAAGDGLGNLRLADRSQQIANTRRRADNTSGHRGVYWKARDSKWTCGAWHKGVYHHGGSYEDKQAAIAARQALAARLHGDFVTHD